MSYGSVTSLPALTWLPSGEAVTSSLLVFPERFYYDVLLLSLFPPNPQDNLQFFLSHVAILFSFFFFFFYALKKIRSAFPGEFSSECQLPMDWYWSSLLSTLLAVSVLVETAGGPSHLLGMMDGNRRHRHSLISLTARLLQAQNLKTRQLLPTVPSC